ncbi:VanZ like family protein [Mucisphaera calidilacus]|uniref:VanZ like family protein n=2 Tax=Mucisphaera calidilacus TaxID=2527982 RepID=A0A518BW79_9BACT|nr:VanZ like family protein [Mucisphaera calidilacus]
MLWSALLIYGGMIPFDQSWGHVARDGQSATAVLATALAAPTHWYVYPEAYSSAGMSKAASDLLANTLIFLPLGLLWMLAWRPRAGFNAGLGLSILLAATVSWTMETTQAFSPARVSAANDVLVNTGAATLGAIIAIPVRHAMTHLSLHAYRINASTLHHLYDSMRELRRHPDAGSWAIGTAVLMGLLIAIVLTRLIDSGSGIVPFAEQWQRSYDVAATQLLIAFLGYTLVALLIIALLVKPRANSGWTTAMIVIAAISFSAELARASFTQTALDVTLPLMAVGTALTIMCACLSAMHLMRRACRRKTSVPVENDRRRRRHDYSFRIGT